MTFCLRVVRASWKNVRQVVIKTTPSDILRNVPFTQVINNHYKKKRPRRTLREFQKGSMNTCVYKPAKMCVYIYRYVLCVCFIRMQVYVLGHIHTYMYTYTHTWIRTHTHTHTHTHSKTPQPCLDCQYIQTHTFNIETPQSCLRTHSHIQTYTCTHLSLVFIACLRLFESDAPGGNLLRQTLYHLCSKNKLVLVGNCLVQFNSLMM